MKKYIKNIISWILLLVLVNTWMPAAQVQAQEGKSYTVTLRAGNVGSFDTEKFEALCQNAEVTANYVKFQVDRGNSLVDMGFLKEAAELDSVLLNSVVIKGDYLLKSAVEIAGQQITSNTEYVLDYGKLVDPVEYSIYFVDSESGEQIAAPTLAYGNAGDVINVVPVTIDGYETEDGTKELVLSKEAENTITFRYTFTSQETTVIVPPQEQENVVTVPTEVPEEALQETEAANEPEEQEEALEEENQPVEIEEEEVPLADTSTETTEIEDEDVPLAAASTENSNMIYVAAGIAAAIILLGAVVLYYFKKKRGIAEKK